MGSAPSTIEVPPGMHIQEIRRVGDSKAPSRKKKSGFQEVEMRHTPDSMGGGGQSSFQEGGSRRSKGASSGNYGDLNVVVREKTNTSKKSDFEVPTYTEEDDLALETFYHKEGTTYTCLYQAGQRFYLDSWQTQDWQPFPQEWYKLGVIVTDKVMKNEDVQRAGGGASGAVQAANAPPSSDDREGFIDHPSRGRMPTYVFEEKRNVHYYFDKTAGCWVRLPIAWELRSELIQKLMEPIQEALPDWKDTQDMMAALRCSNYDPHDCIATFLTVNDTEATPRNKVDAKNMREKDERIKALEDDVKRLKTKVKSYSKKLDVERHEKAGAESKVAQLLERTSSLEAESAAASATVESLQRERPKTAHSRSATPAKCLSDSSSNLAVVADDVISTPEAVVDPSIITALGFNMKELHKDYSKLKHDLTARVDDMNHLMKQLTFGVVNLRSFDSHSSSELEQTKELYRRECLQRKLLYNKLQEARGNIRVFCRCRYDDRVDCCIQFPNDHEIVTSDGRKGMKFDRVFSPQSTQNEVFEEAKPIITSCVDGYNVCILAYGQTGSGKTHTMQGIQSDPGVNVRSIQELLQICAERDNIKYTLKASMVEIYNETIQDLLSSNLSVLEIRSQGKNIHLPGLTEMFVETLEDIDNIMALGDKNRHTASTKMNSTSSRSHLIFMISLEGEDKASGSISHGTLTLCDLAGSERVSKTDATGQRLVEAAAINKSLTALGQVFTSLRTGQMHIPYRNSKLTHILQPCLGGDSKACMFAAVSPAESNITETVSTLQFASNARQVALGKATQNVKKGPPQGGRGGAWDMEDA